ncbi:TIGR00341 family protein [Salinigranum marinum]|uniref:TIGR00341 family protein n=1 Tax=Salinigranum marinum TaxID=1515595 RepID=UPI002989B23B|nr:TIGR00341 family protein [Salinigranum marinum]
MRLVQVTVPAGKREAVTSTLDDDGVDYVLTDETSGREYTAVVSFPLPTAAVESVLDDLREAGLERDSFTVVVNAETVVSRRFEELQAEYEETAENGDRISRDELTARAREMAPSLVTFVVMTLISTVVATAGVLVDSPAVVVGSMVIAPLIGPAMATSVGTVVDDEELFDRGVRLQVLGGVLAVAGAAVFAFAVRWSGIVPLTATEVFAIGEVRERLSPDVLSLAVALGAGVAGALSLSTGVSSALVGVMIAAALVPPTAVVGIGIAWGRPTAVVGSAVLVLVNFLAINLVALAVLWHQGYRPERWFKLDEARTATLKRIAVLAVGLVVLSAFLAGVTYSTYRTATFEEDARAAVAAELEATDTELELLSMTVEYEDFPFRRPTRVVVTVGHPIDTEPPPLADRLGGRVRAVARQPPPPQLPVETNGDVAVDVRYVPVDGSPGE